MFEVFESKKLVKVNEINDDIVFICEAGEKIAVRMVWTCCSEAKATLVSFKTGTVTDVTVTNTDYDTMTYRVIMSDNGAIVCELVVSVEAGDCSWDKTDYTDVSVTVL